MIKRAIISGLPSAGINVWDLGSQPLPVARYFTKISGAVGGVHVRLSPFDERVVDISFMDSEGLNISKAKERDVERIFFREDFRRVYLEDIGSIDYAQQVKEHYIDDFLKHLNTKAIEAASFDLVVDFADAPVANVLPLILDKLNCNVVSINANIERANTPMSQSRFQLALKQMQIITTALATQLGARLAPGGERLFLVDDRGYLLAGTTACAAMVELALRDAPGGSVAIPLDMPDLFEAIAARHGGRIIRTETDPDALIQAISTEKVIMAGDSRGHFIFPDFHCAVDGMMALAKILEFLATQKVSLGAIVSNMPPYYLAERKVSCAWEAKARVMRLIHEKFESYKHMINGAKINLDLNKWVLIIPDPDQPYFRVVVEATSLGEAETLADEYAQIIERISPLE
jgi:mannose-1-phosphate guanylyltransferase/phosphomannomutase